ncbi:MAG: hypothetical protein IPK22_10870 [Verrucomicrobiaceae bacterium]|nr:hypothetical protein [Verrucomicrobiaceae bacterium]
MSQRKFPSFSRSFAQEHTVTEAVILKHLAYKVGRSKNWRDDKQWFYESTKELQKKFHTLALPPSTRISGRWAKAILEIGNYNPWKQDRTRWFHVPKEFRNAVESDTITFNSDDAVHHKITAAVLLHNLRHNLKRKLKKSEGTNVVHEMSPAVLSKIKPTTGRSILPFSESTIKATLKTLVEKGVILKTSTTKPEYTLPPSEMQDLRREAKLKS